MACKAYTYLIFFPNAHRFIQAKAGKKKEKKRKKKIRIAIVSGRMLLDECTTESVP
jgi:hypothetical protein